MHIYYRIAVSVNITSTEEQQQTVRSCYGKGTSRKRHVYDTLCLYSQTGTVRLPVLVATSKRYYFQLLLPKLAEAAVIIIAIIVNN